MKRFSSQLIFCSPDKILKNTLIEQDDKNKNTNFIQLDQSLYEPAQTLFFDGIISTVILSLKESLGKENINQFINNFQYLDLSEKLISEQIKPSDKPLLIDFGTKNIETANSKLKKVSTFLYGFSTLEIIAACTYLPNKIVGDYSTPDLNNVCSFILWENIDFRSMRISKKTHIRYL